MNLLAPTLALRLAALSYRWVEHPIRTQPHLRAWPALRRIAIFAAAMALACLVANALLDEQPHLGLGTVKTQSEDWYGNRHLDRRTLAASRLCAPTPRPIDVGALKGAGTRSEPVDCAEMATTQLLVLGDSHATTYLSLLEQLSAEQVRAVTDLPTPGSSYLDMKDALDAGRNPACRRTASDALRGLLDLACPGELVFLPALRLQRPVELGGARRVPVADGDPYARTPAEGPGVARAVAATPRSVRPLLDAGLQVVLEAPKPVFRIHPFACVEIWNHWNSECRPGLHERHADRERPSAPRLDALRVSASRSPGVSV